MPGIITARDGVFACRCSAYQSLPPPISALTHPFCISQIQGVNGKVAWCMYIDKDLWTLNEWYGRGEKEMLAFAKVNIRREKMEETLKKKISGEFTPPSPLFINRCCSQQLLWHSVTMSPAVFCIFFKLDKEDTIQDLCIWVISQGSTGKRRVRIFSGGLT